jgi:hypothetical protein
MNRKTNNYTLFMSSEGNKIGKFMNEKIKPKRLRHSKTIGLEGFSANMNTLGVSEEFMNYNSRSSLRRSEQFAERDLFEF